MAKKLVGEVKFHVPGGQATPAPPVGTALGRFGINLGQFVQQFNDRTKEDAGMPIPVVVQAVKPEPWTSLYHETPLPAPDDSAVDSINLVLMSDGLGNVGWKAPSGISNRQWFDLIKE